PPTVPDGSALPYPGAYMQPFFPMPAGYNPYNPFFNQMAPPYPTAGAPQYPMAGANQYPNAGAPQYPQAGYGVPRPAKK
ncbi:unnamed protein product, partial [Adineta steineri]